MDSNQLESEIRDKGLNAPRLTPADIDAAIDRVMYVVFDCTTTTVCCIVLKNGFTVTGESACVSPQNFDADIGARLAYDRAHEKIWQLEGYRIKSLLAAQL